MNALDFLHTTYSEDDLNRLTTSKEGIEGKWLGGVKNWVQKSGCFQAALTMDQLAEAALNGPTKLTELKVLKENLKVHDRVIRTFNSRFYLVACPNHEAMERRLQERIEQLELLERKHFLHRITQEVERGMPIDRDNLPSIIKKADRLFNGKLPQELDRVLAVGYIQTLFDNIQSGKIDVPLGFHFLGELPPEKIEEGKKQFLAWLQIKLDQEMANPTPALELVKAIQEHFIERVATTLSTGSTSHLKTYLKTLHNFDIKVNREVRRAQNEVRELAQSTYETTKDTLTPMRQRAFDIFLKTPTLMMSFPTRKLYQEVFDSLPSNWQDLPDAPQLLEKALERKMPSKEAFFDHYSGQMLEAVETISNIKWFDIYGHRRVFAFDQSMYGLGAMLGEGSCLAITYRWNKILQKNPALALSSPEDLREADLKHDTTAGSISRRDRLIQAMHVVERFRYTLVNQGILKKDGLTEHRVFERSVKKPFREVHADLLVKKNDWPDPRGVFILHATDDTKHGHAMGLQIDPANNIYRFYDVNSGMYQFPSLEELKEATSTYIEEIYPNYDRFNFLQHA